MESKLVIVESPAKAKTIGKFLGSGYKVVASNGHVRDLPRSQLGVDVDNGFLPKYITLRGRGEVLEKIRKEAKGVSKIYLATDPDREGEAISWHLAQILKIDEKQPCRIVFNEITNTAVKGAIKAPRAIDRDLVDAQQARRILDRLVGYKISPILWQKVKKGLSAGRVQSVATRIIVDREQEIADFTPEEYWNIHAQLSDNGKDTFEAALVSVNGKKLEVRDEQQAKAIEAELNGLPYSITGIKKSEKSRHPAPPFTTSNLQQEASRKLNFTTKRTMLIAQQLYEGVDVGKGTSGLVTYIRTDSVRVSSEALAQLREMIAKKYGGKYLPENPNFYKGRKNSQDAHEAIRPTDVNITPDSIKDAVTSDQYKLYKLIYNRFVASQMADARFNLTAVSIEAKGKEVFGFKATGTRPLFDGFMAVYIEGIDNEKSVRETKLPELAEGSKLECLGVKSEQWFTQPPPRYSEAALVKELEERGIGRPSTYSPTITTIIERGYVRREKRMLYSTELGAVVTRIMIDNFTDIVDVKFTADMEEKLDKIEDGETSIEGVLSEFYAPFEKTLKEASEKIEKIEIADELSDVQCEKCGAMMVYKMGRFGKFLACPKYPECKNTKQIVEAIKAPCPKCGAKLLKRKAKKSGKTFYGCEKYPECDFISWDMPSGEICPKCGTYMVAKSSKSASDGRIQVLHCANKECGNEIQRSIADKEDADA